MDGKYQIVTCPQCDENAGYIKDGKIHRGTSPCFNNYCWSCLKDLTNIINKYNLESKSSKI
jgi:hypothetical protein